MCRLPGLSLALLACGGKASNHLEPPRPAVSAAAEPTSTEGASIADAGAVVALREDCWNGVGNVFPQPIGPPIPLPASTKTYPLFFRVLSKEEREAREEAFARRYPERTIRLDEVGIVYEVALTRMPCEAKDEIASRGGLTMKTYETMQKFTAKLESEMSDVVGLGHYGAIPQKKDGAQLLVLRQMADVPDALVRGLPKELDDAALLARYAGERVQWTRTVRRDVVVRVRMPCGPAEGVRPSSRFTRAIFRRAP